MDLQNTFYVLGIITMSLMLVMLIALVIAVFAIKAKINSIHRQIEEKLRGVQAAARVGEAIFDTAKKVAERRHK